MQSEKERTADFADGSDKKKLIATRNTKSHENRKLISSPFVFTLLGEGRERAPASDRGGEQLSPPSADDADQNGLPLI